jgi:hypothetical protein
MVIDPFMARVLAKTRSTGGSQLDTSPPCSNDDSTTILISLCLVGERRVDVDVPLR